MKSHDFNENANKKSIKIYPVIQSHTQAGDITTNLNDKIDFTFTELSGKKIVTWNCHMNDSTKCRYDMILGRCIITALALNLKFFYRVIE